jgi:hypothetical protein
MAKTTFQLLQRVEDARETKNKTRTHKRKNKKKRRRREHVSTTSVFEERIVSSGATAEDEEEDQVSVAGGRSCTCCTAALAPVETDVSNSLLRVRINWPSYLCARTPHPLLSLSLSLKYLPSSSQYTYCSNLSCFTEFTNISTLHFNLLWCILTLDVKSVLNENLGGILGGTQCC